MRRAEDSIREQLQSRESSGSLEAALGEIRACETVENFQLKFLYQRYPSDSFFQFHRNMFAKRQSARDNSIESRRRSSIKESDFFSLNLRILAIRKLQEKDDPYTVDASMVWQRLSAGYRIVDLRLNRFMQTLHFVLVHRRPKYSLLRLKDIRKFRSKCLLDRTDHPMLCCTLVILNGNNFLCSCAP